MIRLNPCHYVWTTEEDGQYWAYCYCAWTSPRFGVRVDAIELGKNHMTDAKFRFIEEGIPYHFEVVSEFIGRGLEPSQVDGYHDDATDGDVWMVSAHGDDEVAVTIRHDSDRSVDLWHACDTATGVEFFVGDLEAVVSAAAGVIRRAEAIDAITP